MNLKDKLNNVKITKIEENIVESMMLSLNI